jgi:hypothetical protein
MTVGGYKLDDNGNNSNDKVEGKVVSRSCTERLKWDPEFVYKWGRSHFFSRESSPDQSGSREPTSGI